MQYEKIKKYLAGYDTLYSQGMKKDANRELQELCLWIDSLAPEIVDALLKKLVEDICETETFAFLFKRGNGQLPFQLKKIVRNWLLPRCQEEQIPELRWFYQIYKNDPDNAEYAYSCLVAAYAHATNDSKTQKLLFERNVEALEFGLHELPIGLLISDEEAQHIFQQCGAVIQRGYAPTGLIERYIALKQEYDAYINSKNG